MASQQSTVDFICEQMSGAGDISARKMFGEYGVYCDAKFIGVICNDMLYLKPTTAGAAVGGALAVTGGRSKPYRRPASIARASGMPSCRGRSST